MANYKGDWDTRQSDEQGYAYNAFKRFYGRDPSETELAQITGAYQSGDRNRPNLTGGDSYVAALYESQKNKPPTDEELAAKAPEQYGGVDAIYKELLNRGASQAELDHFGKMLASGEVDPYELRSFISSQDEYRSGKDKEFRGELAGELEDYDTKVFDREKENVISRYAQMGRTGSSSLDFALTDLMGKISQERSKYLAQVGTAQYEGNKGAAREDYLTGLNRMFGEQDYTRGRTAQLEDMMRGRGFEIDDYNRQSQDYARFMESQGKGGSAGKAIGSVIGGGVGAFWGPEGAQAGMAIGGSGGGMFDYFNS